MGRCWFVLLALAGCSQILGVKDITLGDAGSGSGHPDAMQQCVTANTVTPAASKLFIACLDTLPSAPVTLSGTIDTDTSPMCITGKQANSGPDVCMIAGMKITISSPVGARGSRPLVLVALTDIDVSAQIDISGDQVSSGMLVQAPGANIGCGAPSAGGDSATSPGGGGGAAFGGASGAGGPGSMSATGPGAGGSGGTTTALSFIHGGCDGAAGGNNASVAGGAAGTAGGALYMIASNSIEIESGATILAGGGGGRGGLVGGSGGGGGASGGLVGFDSPSVGLDGSIIANGGGGGGGGNQASQGGDGETGTFGAATGGVGAFGGSATGGKGGDGGVGTTAATSGMTPTGGAQCGGGGGGGSIGVIWNDSQFSTVNGNGVSPDPIGP